MRCVAQLAEVPGVLRVVEDQLPVEVAQLGIAGEHRLEFHAGQRGCSGHRVVPGQPDLEIPRVEGRDQLALPDKLPFLHWKLEQRAGYSETEVDLLRRLDSPRELPLGPGAGAADHHRLHRSRRKRANPCGVSRISTSSVMRTYPCAASAMPPITA